MQTCCHKSCDTSVDKLTPHTWLRCHRATLGGGGANRRGTLKETSCGQRQPALRISTHIAQRFSANAFSEQQLQTRSTDPRSVRLSVIGAQNPKCHPPHVYTHWHPVTMFRFQLLRAVHVTPCSSAPENRQLQYMTSCQLRSKTQ
jgi:hypothetical protein